MLYEVITISPGGDGNDTFSNERICIRPGTDRFLAAAVIKLLAEDRRIAPAVLVITSYSIHYTKLYENKNKTNLFLVVSLASVIGRKK